MVNQNIVKAKINHIQNCLQRLKEKQHISETELKGSADLQDIIVHNLQLAIQGCIDVASHVVSDEGWAVPDTLAGLFDILKQHKVIPPDLNEKLKKMVGFRNIIIHEYANMDMGKVFRIFTHDIEDIGIFLKYICEYAKL